MGTRLLCKFRSGRHVLNEELGRHRDREGKIECNVSGAECESVVLWEGWLFLGSFAWCILVRPQNTMTVSVPLTPKLHAALSDQCLEDSIKPLDCGW